MSLLWSVNSNGIAFVLSTAGHHWQELQYHGIEFKRISANEFFTWAIGGDHQIYIYVPIRDVPIRCRVVSYENERWNPVHGFSQKLLPTDRPHWSSSDGLVALPLKSFHLPSESWQWEEEWYVEDNLDGQPLEPEGWTYAIDFPAKYGPNKTWNSLVRRRKWVRYRRFSAMNKWALVPSIHEDPVQEPFIDISVGGTDIPGGDTDRFAVWAVTILGRVVFRYGVSTSSPEGTGWVPVSTPEKCEVNQIVIGPTGLLWAVTWEGSALVRTGVTRENIMGSSWILVDPPNEDEKLLQISVGTNVIWAVSRTRKVWFRKGIKGLDAGTSDASAQGSGWIEMVGEMLVVSVGLNDQVFGISPDGHIIYIRTGVTSSALSGKTWKPIEVPKHSLHRLPSLSSLDSYSSSSLPKETHSVSDDTSYKNFTTASRKTSAASMRSSPVMNRQLKKETQGNILPSFVTRKDSTVEKATNDVLSTFPSGGDCLNDRRSEDGQVSESSTDRQSISSFDTSYHGHFPSDVWDSAIGGMGDVAEVFHDEFSWMWISASGCLVDPESLPLWFLENVSLGSHGPGEPWYEDLLSQFKKRQQREMQEYTAIPRAIEKSTWVKTGICEWYKGIQWVKCLLELEEEGLEQGAERGFLTCHHKKDQLKINLIEITCVVRGQERNRSFLAIYTHKRTIKGKPHKFYFTADEDLEDWLATLNNSCRSINNLSQRPDKTSAWSTTANGDVYVHSTSASMELSPPSKMFWNLLGGGHLHVVETCPAGIVWGLGYNCTAWVYTGGYGGGAYRGIPGCNATVSPMCDTRCLYIYENQRWNPLTGFTAKGLPTDRYMWSDGTGRFECTKENTHLPSNHWHWVSDWCIDYKTPGGVDNQGWQYATDFPRSYHAYKSFTDYVRRRRWIRKCRLMTSGPWKQLGTTPLLDVSFQVDASTTKDETIAVWAVATNGDVLMRVGVTANNPSGNSWVHISTEKQFRSISVGADNAVWGVATDGSAQLRHGISSQTPNGLFWCHVEPPQMSCHLRQISAGTLAVLAVDDSNKLWSREEIVDIFKEGTHWKLISEDVKQVSVGPIDQIWAVMDRFETPAGIISGVVCQRVGIDEENIYGTEWRHGIGGSWNHLCIRGCLFEEDNSKL